MNILIIGEYSSFSKELKKGFVSLGHSCSVFSWGDGFKKIKQSSDDYTFDIANIKIFNRQIRGTNRLKKIVASIKLHKIISRLVKKGVKFDTALVINYEFLQIKESLLSPFFTWEIINKLLKNKGNIFLSLCGNDFVFDSSLKLLNKYSPDVLHLSKFINNKKELEKFNFFKKHIYKAIPVTLSYALAYRNSSNAKCFKLLDTIPLPIDCKEFEYNNQIGHKIIVFHGYRKHAKGSDLIIEAMKLLQKRYSALVEIVIVENLPLDKYIEKLSSANIVVDQCYSLGYGMNALYSLAMGKVVLSGNDVRLKDEFNVSSIPIVDIHPNVIQIFNALESLVTNKELLLSKSKESYHFVNNIHCTSRIAKLYLEEFSSHQNVYK